MNIRKVLGVALVFALTFTGLAPAAQGRCADCRLQRSNAFSDSVCVVTCSCLWLARLTVLNYSQGNCQAVGGNKQYKNRGLVTNFGKGNRSAVGGVSLTGGTGPPGCRPKSDGIALYGRGQIIDGSGRLGADAVLIHRDGDDVDTIHGIVEIRDGEVFLLGTNSYITNNEKIIAHAHESGAGPDVGC